MIKKIVKALVPVIVPLLLEEFTKWIMKHLSEGGVSGLYVILSYTQEEGKFSPDLDLIDYPPHLYTQKNQGKKIAVCFPISKKLKSKFEKKLLS